MIDIQDSINAKSFEAFPKIARLSREMIITEKLDGINAQVSVTDAGEVLAGSRNLWLTLEKDNYGFAHWVKVHEEELRELGPGRHFGEWWGQGIQRGYGLKEKRFSLFNVSRWSKNRPKCCGIVPMLYRGLFDTVVVDNILEELKTNGSQAVPGWKDPEGIVLFHTACGYMFKKTIKNDEQGKGQ